MRIPSPFSSCLSRDNFYNHLEQNRLGRDCHSYDYVEALLMQILTSLPHFGQLDVKFQDLHVGQRQEYGLRGEIVTQDLPDEKNRWHWSVHSYRSA